MMEIRQSLAEYGITIAGNATGNVKLLCPNCSHHRKHKNDLCLSVNVSEGIWRCHNCGWRGSVHAQKKRYVIPEYAPKADLTDRSLAYLKSRGLTETVLTRNSVTDGSEFMPQVGKAVNCIQFPYFIKNRVVNIKYRDGAKHFKMVKDAELVLYKFDDLFTGDGQIHKWCAIVEGEIDALSLEVAGITQCVSVPNGAPPPGSKANFAYLDSAMLFLEKLERVRIAVDNDEAGQTLERELVRRIGSDKCLKVVWPDGCKDANDVLVKYGAQRVRECVLEEAREYPAPGIVRVRDLRSRVIDLYNTGKESLGVSTGWPSVDPYYRPVPGQWTVITAMPNVGKSPWLRHLMVNIAINDGWKYGLWAPEDDPIEEDIITILQQYGNQPFFSGYHARMDESDRDEMLDWMDEHFFWISLEEDVEPTLDAIHEKAQYLVARHGINGLLIDPFNEIDVPIPNNSSLTRAIGPFCRQVRQFSRRNEIHTWLVAHPTKLEKIISSPKKGEAQIKVRYPVPTLYDIAHSAEFRNKADVGIALDRDLTAEWGTRESKITDVYIQKMKKKRAGRLGKISLEWDSLTGRYLDMGYDSRPTSVTDSRYEVEREYQPTQDEMAF